MLNWRVNEATSWFFHSRSPICFLGFWMASMALLTGLRWMAHIKECRMAKAWADTEEGTFPRLTCLQRPFPSSVTCWVHHCHSPCNCLEFVNFLTFSSYILSQFEKKKKRLGMKPNIFLQRQASHLCRWAVLLYLCHSLKNLLCPIIALYPEVVGFLSLHSGMAIDSFDSV